MKHYLKYLIVFLSFSFLSSAQNVKSVQTTSELVQLTSGVIPNYSSTSFSLFQTVIVNQGSGAGTYALTNTIINTNLNTRLASVGIPGYSWDLINAGSQYYRPPYVKTVVGSQLYCYGTTGFTGDNGVSSIYAIAASQRVLLPVNCYGVQPVYIGYIQTDTSAPGWTYSNGFENALPNALEVACSITDSTGRQYPQTFNGNRIGRLNPYGYLFGDDNLQQYNAGDYLYSQFWVNRLVSNTNTYNNGEVGLITKVGAYLPTFTTHPGDSKSGYSAVSGYNALNATQTRIDTAGSVSGNYPFTGQGFTPYTYVGYVKASDLNTVVAVGDSITAGIGDTADLLNLNSGGGYLYRTLRTTNPLLNLGVGGDKAQSWAVTNGTSRTTFRTALLAKYGYKYVYYNEGYNDINFAGRSLAQLTNDVANQLATIYNLTGAKIIVGTLTCGQNSVSGKYFGPGDLSPQYPNATNVAPAYNALLRTNPAAISPYIWKVWDQAALWSPDDINARYITNSLYQGTVTTTNSTTFLNVYWRTLIDTNANWATNQWVGQPVQITNTVAPSWPANLMVASNSPNTLYLFAPSGLGAVSLVTTNYLTAGATYSIGNGGYTSDGSHPNPWVHAIYASNIVSQAIFK